MSDATLGAFLLTFFLDFAAGTRGMSLMPGLQCQVPSARSPVLGPQAGPAKATHRGVLNHRHKALCFGTRMRGRMLVFTSSTVPLLRCHGVLPAVMKDRHVNKKLHSCLQCSCHH
ncbi:uncharacterized protein [Cherax quadricarinatus]|uniref:uncharacterized protein n=1 Tax=Cherax quadricarinatus TaxID=27406 RepID=UPI00387EC866